MRDTRKALIKPSCFGGPTFPFRIDVIRLFERGGIFDHCVSQDGALFRCEQALYRPASPSPVRNDARLVRPGIPVTVPALLPFPPRLPIDFCRDRRV